MLSLQFSRAQIQIPPTLSFDLGAPDVPETQVWDLNGTYVVSLEVLGKNGLSAPVQVAFTLIHSPNGKLTTTTNEPVNCSVVFNGDAQSAFACLATISGKVTGVAGLARVHFSIHFTGNGNYTGRATTINGSLSVDAEVDSTSEGQLLGVKVSKFNANFPQVGNTIKGPSDFAAGLPPGVNGSWNLTLKLLGLSKLTGTGVIALPSESLGVHLSGKFKNGLVSVKATGADDVPNTVSGKGVSGNILLPPSFDTIQFDGKILGQKLTFNVTTAAPE
jgi:hypothetical protein